MLLDYFRFGLGRLGSRDAFRWSNFLLGCFGGLFADNLVLFLGLYNRTGFGW